MSCGGSSAVTWTANTSLTWIMPTTLSRLSSIDRQAAVARLGERGDQRLEAGRRRHRDDVGARHRHVARRLLAEMEDVAEHLPLDIAEVADAAAPRPRGSRSLPRSRRAAWPRCRRRTAGCADRSRKLRPSTSWPPGLSSSMVLGIYLCHPIGIGDPDGCERLPLRLLPSPRRLPRSFHGRNLADAACRAPPDARHGFRPVPACSAASSAQMPCARTMSPSSRLRRRADLLFLDHRKGEHVGRLVLAAPGRVQRAHFHRRR